MPSQTIVIVSDGKDPKYGEISVLDTPEQAERLLEVLLESGFEPDRIRVFAGTEMVPQISFRPVVSLGDELSRTGEPDGAGAEAGLADESADGKGAASAARFSSQFRPA